MDINRHISKQPENTKYVTAENLATKGHQNFGWISMNRKNGIIKSFKIFYNRSSSHFMFVNLRKYCVMNCVVHHYCTHVCHPFKILTLCLIYVRNIMCIRPISRETWRGFITLFATSRTHIKIWQSLTFLCLFHWNVIPFQTIHLSRPISIILL